jgi:NAD(P)-dependent dehydrogenase (short-subunit alcohol dehydrogenase family)
MTSTPSLSGKTLFITGASRGIGLAIACARRATGPTW